MPTGNAMDGQISPYIMGVLADAFTEAERKRILRIAQRIIERSSDTSSWGRATRSAINHLIREAQLGGR